MRFSIAEFLRAADCRVIEAEHGEKAREVLLNGEPVDVVFTDIQLGGKFSGWDVAEAARNADPTVNVIYTSAAVWQAPPKVPGSVFFPKPYEPKEILEACKRVPER